MSDLFRYARAISQSAQRTRRQPPALRKAPTGGKAATAKPKTPTPAVAPAPRPQRPHSDPEAVSILAIRTGGKAYDAMRERLASNPKVSLQDSVEILEAAWADDARSRVSLVGV